MIGSAKAAVLPVPVCAEPMTSRALQDERDRLGLDRGRLGVALLLDGERQGVEQAQLGERRVHLRHVDRNGRLHRRVARMLEVVARRARLAAVAGAAMAAVAGGAGPGQPALGAALVLAGTGLLGP